MPHTSSGLVVEFQTERLLVRRWHDSDLPALHAVDGDARVAEDAAGGRGAQW